jgi:cell division protein FtsX
MMYNPAMNLMKLSSVLLSFFIAAVLLLSMWVAGAQDLYAQDVLENGEIVLTLDADSPSNDSLEQVALISRISYARFISHNDSYPQMLVRVVVPNCFPPPDRPPAEFV